MLVNSHEHISCLLAIYHFQTEIITAKEKVKGNHPAPFVQKHRLLRTQIRKQARNLQDTAPNDMFTTHNVSF